MSNVIENQNAVSPFDANPLLAIDILGIVKSRLQQAASNSDLFVQIFGDKANTAEIQSVRSQWVIGDFSQLPSIQILSASNMNGGFGAYASSNETVYLSDALFQNGAVPPNSFMQVAGVLVEETFHWLDDRVGVDTAGDEGELARNLVFGTTPSSAELTRIRQEDDLGFITVNGQAIAVEQDNALATAINLGTLGSATQTFANFVGSTDTNDYYRFNLSTISNFSLVLNGLSADADVQLLNSSGAIIQSSTAGGASPEAINRQLAAGTYFVRVYPFSGNTNYSLSLSAPLAPIPDSAGNTLATARNLGPLIGNQTFTDFVGSIDTNDYYQFSLANASSFSLVLNGLSADADVQLLNSSGAVIQSSSAGGTSPDAISRQLAAGTYFVRVYPFSGNTNYNLSLTALNLDLAGNTFATARNLGTLSGTQTFADAVGVGDTNDYYRFTLSNTSNFSLLLNGLSADADVHLLNSSGAIIQSSTAGGASPEAISRQLAAGTYFVRVYPYSGNTNYNLILSAFVPDLAGNNLGAARDLGSLSGTQTFTDFVGSSDTNDYYRFTLTSASSFSLLLNGLSADADVQLLNSNGGIIQSSTFGGTTPDSISRPSLAAGTYYVRVFPFSGNTNYSLSLSALTLDLAGNTFATARNIGALSSATQTFTDSVGSSDTNDFYRFTLANSSNFSLLLNGLSADADVQLYNGSGVLIQTASAGSTAPDSINRQLAAGTYFVRVYPFSGNTNYNLSLTATSLLLPVPDFAGNTLATARNLGNLSSPRTFNDYVGSNDTNDFYRFNLTQNSNFSLLLNGLSADADVRLLNSSGVVIQSSTAGGTSSEAISRLLTAGTYYVQVYPYIGNTNYSLSLSATALAIPDLAGNTPATARDLGTLSSITRTVQDFVGTTDTNDYYRFNLSATSNFSLALNGLTSDADVQLLNSTGSVVIQGSYLEGSLSESITRTLSAGTYYIRVFPFNGATNYNLSVVATPTVIILPPIIRDGAGNTLAAARDIGILTTAQTFSDFVGSTDTNDYYKFTLAQNGYLSLNLNGLSSDADVELLNSSGGLIQRAAAGGLSAEVINRLLNAGTYYVRVYPFVGNTNYQLTLGATTAAPTAFDSTYGYGAVNAAAAVARALGQSTPFANVADLGGNNWGNDQVNAPEAWARGYTGQGVVVAVIDSGVDITHPDLVNNIWRNTGEIAGNGVDDDGNGYVDDINGWNFGANQNNNNVSPGSNSSGQRHGTHVAGTIAARNNGVGITGVAYNARIMSVRLGNVSDNGFFTNPGNLASAIRYAVDNGARVINMSIGWSDSTELSNALAYAASRNVITVSAAGNAGASSPGNPARYATQYGISVGAVDRNRNIASFSNRAGTNSAMRHVVAPGVAIYSTTPGNTYSFMSGTSMAAPHVAGVVALMLSANRNLTSSQVRDILTSSASRLSSSTSADFASTTNTNFLGAALPSELGSPVSQSLASVTNTSTSNYFADTQNSDFGLTINTLSSVMTATSTSNSLSSRPISNTVATAGTLNPTDLFGDENWNYDLVNDPNWLFGTI